MWRSLVSSLLAFGILLGQDMHLSLVPLYQRQMLNPAFAGLFEGTVRISGIYRNQWQGIAGYNTLLLTADAPLLRDVFANDIVGLGLMGYKDVAGQMRMGVMELRLSAAYHKILSKTKGGSKMWVLSAGVAVGYMQRGIYAPEGVQSPTQWEGTHYNPSASTGETFRQVALMDLNAGVALSARLRQIDGMAWISVAHPLEPSFTLRNAQVQELAALYRKWTLGLHPVYHVGKSLDLAAGLTVFYQQSAFLTQGYVLGEYKMKGKKVEPAADKPLAQRPVLLRLSAGVLTDHTLGTGPVIALGYKMVRIAFFYQVLLPRHIRSLGSYTPESFVEYIYQGRQNALVPRN